MGFMNGNNKIWASVAGVSVTAAVVIGAALGTNAHHAPPQRPAGHPTPLASTVTVTASARPAAAVPAAVSPSKAKPKVVAQRRHKKHRTVVVVNQEPPVTEPTTSDSTPEGTSTLIDQGPGVVDDSGVRRAPAPPVTIRHPSTSAAVPPPAPSPTTSQGD